MFESNLLEPRLPLRCNEQPIIHPQQKYQLKDQLEIPTMLVQEKAHKLTQEHNLITHTAKPGKTKRSCTCPGITSPLIPLMLTPAYKQAL